MTRQSQSQSQSDTVEMVTTIEGDERSLLLGPPDERCCKSSPAQKAVASVELVLVLFVLLGGAYLYANLARSCASIVDDCAASCNEDGAVANITAKVCLPDQEVNLAINQTLFNNVGCKITASSFTACFNDKDGSQLNIFVLLAMIVAVVVLTFDGALRFLKGTGIVNEECRERAVYR